MILDSVCDCCKKDVAPIEHHFEEGLVGQGRPRNYRPVRVWAYVAPLYHDANLDRVYCSPGCATRDMTANHYAVKPVSSEIFIRNT